MKRVVAVVLGAVVGYAAVAAAGISLASIASISQAEGAYMMGVFFFWGPLGALVGAIAGFLMSRSKS